jgi:hypothetical protein
MEMEPDEIDDLLSAAIAKSCGDHSLSAQEPRDLSRMTLWRYREHLKTMGVKVIPKGGKKSKAHQQSFLDMRIFLSQAAALLSCINQGVRLERDFYSSGKVWFWLGNDSKPILLSTKEELEEFTSFKVGKMNDAANIFSAHTYIRLYSRSILNLAHSISTGISNVGSVVNVDLKTYTRDSADTRDIYSPHTDSMM